MPAKQYHISLNEEQRTRLEQASRSNKRSQRERRRARILLLADLNFPGDEQRCGGGCKDEIICRETGASASTVMRVRQRFFQGGLEAAVEHKEQEKRKARQLDGEGEAHLIALVCGAPPEGHKQWSLRLLSDRLVAAEVVDTISHEAVRTTLKKMNLNPG